MSKQIKDLGTEKTTPADTDLIPIQEAGGTTRRITRGNLLSGISSGAGGVEQYIQIIHSTAAASGGGGSAVSGDWYPRPLSNIQNDATNAASLSASSFILPAGNYRIDAVACFYGVGYAALRLWDLSSNLLLLKGITNYVSGGAEVSLKGKFTISANKNLQLQYRVEQSRNDNGLGLAYYDWGSPHFHTLIDLFKG